MFTGIIEYMGGVLSARSSGGGRRLTVDVGPLEEGLQPGASIAVSGACLTVSSVEGTRAEFDVMAETLRRTTLGDLRTGSKVNLERSLRLGGPLDGHLVQGHVDGVARVRAIDTAGQWLVTFAAGNELIDQMAPKGSVAVDGVSLTLTNVADGQFGVALIPETLGRTTLGSLRTGGKVNVETDIIGKYVRKCLQSSPAAERLTLEKLRDAGYV